MQNIAATLEKIIADATQAQKLLAGLGVVPSEAAPAVEQPSEKPTSTERAKPEGKRKAAYEFPKTCVVKGCRDKAMGPRFKHRCAFCRTLSEKVIAQIEAGKLTLASVKGKAQEKAGKKAA